jgi:hypothetical protein
MDPAHIRMDRMNSGAPLLDTHGRWSLAAVVGVVEKAWIDNGEGRAVVRFSDREDVNGIWQDVQNGIIRNVSVGYAVHRYQIEEAQGNALPVWRAVDWEPMEISLVPVPADAAAGIRAADSSTRLVRCAFETITHEDRNMPPEEENPNTPPSAPSSNEEAIRAAEEAATQRERTRISEIREAVRAGNFGDELADDFISRGVSADEARREVLRRLAERTNRPGEGRGPIEDNNQQREAPKPGTAEEFDAQVRAHMDAGKTRAQAIGLVARSHPTAHAAWISAQNKR